MQINSSQSSERPGYVWGVHKLGKFRGKSTKSEAHGIFQAIDLSFLQVSYQVVSNLRPGGGTKASRAGVGW